MDLSSIGGVVGSAANNNKESVTLLSYGDSKTNVGGTGYLNRFNTNKSGTGNSRHKAAIAKKSDQFFKTLVRRRSKSASRLASSQPDLRGSDYALNNIGGPTDEPADQKITYRVNGERARNPDVPKKPEKVTLVGFSPHTTDPSQSNRNRSSSDLLLECSTLSGRRRSRLKGRKSAGIDFGGSVSNLVCLPPESNSSSPSRGNFATLKTSREVKMERERLRQERMGKMSQESREWFEKVKQQQDATRASLFSSEDRARFFESPSSSSSSSAPGGPGNDLFAQFVRENQERFAQLVQQHRSAVAASSALSSPSPSTSTLLKVPQPAFSTPAPVSLSGSARKATTPQSPKTPKVHRIQIQRENLNCEVNGKSGEVEVRKESESKIEIVVNNGKDSGNESSSSTCCCGNSDVGSSCSSASSDGETTSKATANNSSLGSSPPSCPSSPKPSLSSSSSPSTTTAATVIPKEEEEEEEGGAAAAGTESAKETCNNPEDSSEAGDTISEKCQSSAVLLCSSPRDGIHRSSSSSSRLSSSSSSGFSSIGGPAAAAVERRRHQQHSALALAKLQQLQERRAAFHHPTFANHFGFGRSGTGQRANSSKNNNSSNGSSSVMEESCSEESTPPTAAFFVGSRERFPEFTTSFGSFPSFASPLLSQNSGSEDVLASSDNSSSNNKVLQTKQRKYSSTSTTNIKTKVTGGNSGKVAVTKSKSSTIEYSAGGKERSPFR